MAALTLGTDYIMTELSPNAGLKEWWIQSYNTADATDTFDILLETTLGINRLGLLIVESYVHTTDGSVITSELNTTAVVGETLTITITAGTNNDPRIFHIIGRSTPNVYS